MNNSNFSYDLNASCHLDEVHVDDFWGQYASRFPHLVNEAQRIHNGSICRPPYRSFHHYGSLVDENLTDILPGPQSASFPLGHTSTNAGKQEWRGSHLTKFEQPEQYPARKRMRRKTTNPPTDAMEGVGRASDVLNARPVPSVIMSQSECCSSCSGGVPCGETDCRPCNAEDCSIKETQVVPCNRQSCEQPTCSDTCLSTGIQSQQIFSDYGIIQAGRLTHWLDSPWSPQMPRCATESIQGSLHEVVDPALQLLALSESTIPTTPSMENTFPTPFPQQGGSSIIDDAGLSPQLTNLKQPINNLVGTGALFDPSVQEPPKQFLDNSHSGDGALTIQCAWNGCGQQVGYQDWFPHLHYTHVDPQMIFGCPIPEETCPDNLGQNPIDHMQNAHGLNFDFDMSSGGFSCPAPDCLPGETYPDPAMLHTHFDRAHAVLARGSLQCRLDTCDTTFRDPNDFFSHINEFHTLPPASVPVEDIDLNAPLEPGAVPRRTISVERSIDDISGVVEGAEEPMGEEVTDRCQWMCDGTMCGAQFESEALLQSHVKDHLKGMSKSTGYICHWDGCEREKLGDKAGFSQRGKLERHMHSHTNYKDSRCDWPGCGQMFSAPQSLKQHYRRHTGEKPWKCDEPGCGKSFTQQSSLTCHMRKHTKKKPLVCQTCGKVFSESTNLSKHRSKVHGEIGKHACSWPHCEKTFHRIGQLRTHVKEHRRKALDSKTGVPVSESGLAVTTSEQADECP